MSLCDRCDTLTCTQCSLTTLSYEEIMNTAQRISSVKLPTIVSVANMFLQELLLTTKWDEAMQNDKTRQPNLKFFPNQTYFCWTRVFWEDGIGVVRRVTFVDDRTKSKIILGMKHSCGLHLSAPSWWMRTLEIRNLVHSDEVLVTSSGEFQIIWSSECTSENYEKKLYFLSTGKRFIAQQ